MSSLRRVAWFGLLAAAGVLVAACDDDGDDSCSGALDNVYAVGCDGYLMTEGVTQSDAVEGCQDERAAAKSNGCAPEFAEALECFADLTGDDCTVCDDIVYAYLTCGSAD